MTTFAREQSNMARKMQPDAGEIRSNKSMDNILNAHVKHLRHDEGNQPGEFMTRDINWFYTVFTEGRLDVFGHAQRGMRCNIHWCVQFLKTIVNTHTTVPRIMLCKTHETRQVDGRDKIVSVYTVTDGAQRITAILMYRLGLIKVPVYPSIVLRRSERNRSSAEAEADGEGRFYESAASLNTHAPLVYVEREDKSWGISAKADTEPHVKAFVDELLFNWVNRDGKYHGQTNESLFLSDNFRVKFMGTNLTVAEVPWSQKTACLVNVYQTLQMHMMAVTELACITGDLATEWLKKYEDTLTNFTGQWDCGYSKRQSFGALVQGLLISQGSDFVPSIDDGHLWPILIDELLTKYFETHLDDLTKRRFVAAVRHVHLCAPTPKSKVTADEFAVMIAVIYEAINIEHLAEEESPDSYPEEVISPDDRRAIANCYSLVRSKTKTAFIANTKKLFGRGLADAGTQLFETIKKKSNRNLASAFSIIRDHIQLDTIFRIEDIEFEEDIDIEEFTGNEPVTRSRTRRDRGGPPVKMPRLEESRDDDTSSSSHGLNADDASYSVGESGSDQEPDDDDDDDDVDLEALAEEVDRSI